MELGKKVLLYQAIITFLIGIVFLVQVFNLDTISLTNLAQAAGDGIHNSATEIQSVSSFLDLKSSFNLASYILIMISLVEGIIIIRNIN